MDVPWTQESSPTRLAIDVCHADQDVSNLLRAFTLLILGHAMTEMK